MRSRSSRDAGQALVARAPRRAPTGRRARPSRGPWAWGAGRRGSRSRRWRWRAAGAGRRGRPRVARATASGRRASIDSAPRSTRVPAISPVISLPPSRSVASRTVTRRPEASSRWAAASPAMPPPMTTAWPVPCGVALKRTLHGSTLSNPSPSPERDRFGTAGGQPAHGPRTSNRHHRHAPWGDAHAVRPAHGHVIATSPGTRSRAHACAAAAGLLAVAAGHRCVRRCLGDSGGQALEVAADSKAARHPARGGRRRRRRSRPPAAPRAGPGLRGRGPRHPHGHPVRRGRGACRRRSPRPASAAEDAGGLVGDETTERVDDTHDMSRLVLRVPAGPVRRGARAASPGPGSCCPARRTRRTSPTRSSTSRAGSRRSGRASRGSAS